MLLVGPGVMSAVLITASVIGGTLVQSMVCGIRPRVAVAGRPAVVDVHPLRRSAWLVRCGGPMGRGRYCHSALRGRLRFVAASLRGEFTPGFPIAVGLFGGETF
jgi:hypothetical protein